MGHILHDLKYAVRLLRRSPAFAIAAMLTLAIGIGANTAVFSVIEGVLLRPLPYPEPKRLTYVTSDGRDTSGELTPMSYGDFLRIQESHVFEQAGAFWTQQLNVLGTTDAERLPATRSSAVLLSMLGVKPVIGRNLQPADDDRGSERVVMISHALWQRRFGGRADALGQTLNIEGALFTIVGVMPPDLHFIHRADVWQPLRLTTQTAPDGLHFLYVIGRLRPGMGLAEADRQVATRVTNSALSTETHGFRAHALHRYLVQGHSEALWAVFGAAALVLLIAAANVANLQLAKASARRKEIGVRMALGASRRRLMQQLLAESALFGLIGAGLGVALAWGALAFFNQQLTGVLPMSERISLNWVVLVFTIVVGVGCSILFGLAPALQGTRAQIYDSVREGGLAASASGGALNTRRLLVVGELAISVTLLAAAGLLTKSLLNVVNAERSFATERVLVMTLSPSEARYRDGAAFAQLYDRVQEDLRNLPGVHSVGLTSNFPLSGGGTNGGMDVEGRTYPPGGRPIAFKTVISPSYFQVAGIPLLAGRYFTEADGEKSEQVAIVNQTFARQILPGEDPLTKRVDFLWEGDRMLRIVGVVADVEHYSLETPPQAEVFVPYLQRLPLAGEANSLVIRTQVPPGSLIEVVRQRLNAIDPQMPVANVRTMEEVVEGSVAGRTLPLWLISGFAGIALFLAAIGIYGVLSYGVAQRTHEFGIRMALGAEPMQILAMVLRDGGRMALTGIVAGVAGAAAAARVIAGMLFGVKPWDPLTLAIVGAVLATATLVACYLPARRATRVAPMSALRTE